MGRANEGGTGQLGMICPRKGKEKMMRQHKLVCVILGSWAIVLAVSVAPVYSAGNGGEPFGNPAPISEQTNPGGGGCMECPSMD